MDTYKLFGNHIICFSSSGNEYTIDETSCTCKGFGFRRNCRHFKYATEKGLIQKLINNKTKSVDVSKYFKEQRKDAIRKYLEKKGIKFTKKLIDHLETIVKTNTDPKKFLYIARKGV